MTKEERLVKLELTRRELARRSYKYYLPYVFRNWIKTRMAEYLADIVQAFVETETEHAYDILLIMTPPQHGKSMTVTESFISWYIGRYPNKRCILVAYNDELGEKFGRRNREKIEEFGGVLFGLRKSSKWSNGQYELEGASGSVLARGIKSGITGNPADLMIIDDPIKNREEADSETYRKKLWEAWTETLKTRLQAHAKVICIMTPWHEDDLMGRLKQYEDNVTIIRLPVEAEEDDPLGRAVGDPLCPEIGKDKVWLEDTKRAMINDPTLGGQRAWTALYMCSPRTESGDILKREWWRYYNPAEIHEFGSAYMSVDATFKDGEKNDFVAITIWGKRGNQYFLRDCVNAHLNFPATVAKIVELRTLNPDVSRVLIEDKANGSAIIQTLQSQMLGVIGINPSGGKEARVNAVSHAIEGGNVFLPEGAPWLAAFIDQCAAFPAGKHDDMVDSMSQALNYMIYANGNYLPPDKARQRRIQQENQAREYMVDNAVYDNVYGGYGGFNGVPSDPYGGIYGNYGGSLDGGFGDYL